MVGYSNFYKLASMSTLTTYCTTLIFETLLQSFVIQSLHHSRLSSTSNMILDAFWNQDITMTTNEYEPLVHSLHVGYVPVHKWGMDYQNTQ
jgi:hypothetical protein